MERPLYRSIDWDRRWFPFLKNKEEPARSLLIQLIDTHKSIHDTTIIYCEYQSERYCYTAFDNYKQFVNYYTRFVRRYGTEKAMFGEVILGSVNQKIRFDIDMKDANAFSLYDECIYSVIEITEDLLAEIGIVVDRFSDVIVTSSHGYGKKSGHVIFDNHFHSNSGEARHFHKLVMERIPIHIRPYIDSGVYKSLQNFRCIGCTKPDEFRPKIPTQWVDSNGYEMRWMNMQKGVVNIDPHIIFKSTLISCCSHCKPLPDFGYTAYMDSRPKINIDDALVNVGMMMFAQFYEDEQSTPFEYDGTEGNIVKLRRKRPAYCLICRRSHDKIGGKIIFKGVDFIDIFFDCYRRILPDKELYLGTLESSNVSKYEISLEGLDIPDNSGGGDDDESYYDIPTEACWAIVNKFFKNDPIATPSKKSIYRNQETKIVKTVQEMAAAKPPTPGLSSSPAIIAASIKGYGCGNPGVDGLTNIGLVPPSASSSLDVKASSDESPRYNYLPFITPFTAEPQGDCNNSSVDHTTPLSEVNNNILPSPVISLPSPAIIIVSSSHSNRRKDIVCPGGGGHTQGKGVTKVKSSGTTVGLSMREPAYIPPGPNARGDGFFSPKYYGTPENQ